MSTAQTTDAVICEIQALVGLTVTKKLAAKAVEYVRSNPAEFGPETGMSVSEAADMAIDVARVTS